MLMTVYHQAVAVESHAASEGGLLQFEQGDVILVLDDTREVCVRSCVLFIIFLFLFLVMTLNVSRESAVSKCLK